MHESEVNGIKREIEQLVRLGRTCVWSQSRPRCSRAMSSSRWRVSNRQAWWSRTAAVTRPTASGEFRSRRRCFRRKVTSWRLHVELLALRDRVLAHSDETSNRIAADPFGEHRYTEGYRHWNPNVFAKIAELARAQRAALRRRAEPASRQAETAARCAPGRRSVVDLVPGRRASRARTSSDARWVSARATRPPRRPGRLALRPGCLTRFGRMLSHRDVETGKLQIAA